MIEDKLPRVASELLQLALNDMKLSIDSGVKIRMSDWGTNLNNPETCAVCFAGGVMLNTLSLPKLVDGFGEWSKDVSSNDLNALNSLDDFRSGNLLVGLLRLKVKLRNNKYLSATEVIDDWLDYEDCENDEQFYRQIKDLIIFLKSQDL